MEMKKHKITSIIAAVAVLAVLTIVSSCHYKTKGMVTISAGEMTAHFDVSTGKLSFLRAGNLFWLSGVFRAWNCHL